jgi:capsular polysaccharide biosynthesis protein
MTLRYVAYYLPQFHPFPENDKWWGKGFTEWTNVAKAEPLYDGHNQPRYPTDFGYYDLRVLDTMRDQADVAKAHGIDAFCFHYYWFDGHRLMEKPVDAFLADKSIDMNFCLCWANENWTRRWDAAEHEVLIAQTYGRDWELRFIESLFPYFKDPRYLRVDGKPLLVVYRPQHLPDAKAAGKRWREHCRKMGIGEIHIVNALVHGNNDYEQYEFDAGVEFPPHNMKFHGVNDILPTYEKYNGYAVEYANVARDFLSRDHSQKRIYRTVFPDWDNTARVKNRALIVLGSTVANYERWLRGSSSLTRANRAECDQLVFINAWNEWAEGCYLEPDRTHGRGFLEATLRVKNGTSAVDDIYDVAPERTRFELIQQLAAIPEETKEAEIAKLRASKIREVADLEAKVALLKQVASRLQSGSEPPPEAHREIAETAARSVHEAQSVRAVEEARSKLTTSSAAVLTVPEPGSIKVPLKFRVAHRLYDRPMMFKAAQLTYRTAKRLIDLSSAGERAQKKNDVIADIQDQVAVASGRHQLEEHDVQEVSLESIGRKASSKQELLASNEDSVWTAFVPRKVEAELAPRLHVAKGVFNGDEFARMLKTVPYDAAPLQFGRFHNCLAHPIAVALVTRNNQVIAETMRIYRYVRPNVTDLLYLVEDDSGAHLKAEAATEIDADVIIPMHYSQAFGHVVFDVVPQLLAFRDEIVAERLRIVLSTKAPRWLIRMLSVWGFLPHHFLILDAANTAAYRFRSAIVSNALTTFTTFFPHPESADLMARTLETTPAIQDQPARRIYLGRSSETAYSGRTITNEAELQAALVKRGFKIIDPATLTYPDQIALFADAEIVVGAHGSAFANLIWSRAGTVVFDLMPDAWINFWGAGGGVVELWISRVCALKKFRYNVILCDSSGSSESWQPKSYAMQSKVDVEMFMDHIDQAIKEPSTATR